MLAIELQLTILKVEEKANEVLKGMSSESYGFKCDVSDKDQVAQMLDEIKNKFGESISYVFNGDERMKIHEIQNLDVTLKGSLNPIQGLIPDMKSAFLEELLTLEQT